MKNPRPMRSLTVVRWDFVTDIASFLDKTLLKEEIVVLILNTDEPNFEIG